LARLDCTAAPKVILSGPTNKAILGINNYLLFLFSSLPSHPSDLL